MIFISFPLALVFLGFIIYLALSKKSSPLIRLAALIAIGVIILAVIVCLIIIFAGFEPAAKTGVPADFVFEEPAVPANNLFPIIILAVFILVLLGTVVFLALREQRRVKQEDE
ncbi:hypothetical protein AGMMS50268_17280 [Spirochaetia bacterium]|nr:hypothetical protein AGMMS50268_17280 [Spirochaetia bacterium]